MANIPGEQLPDVGTPASDAIPVVDIPEDDDAQIPGEAPLVAHDSDDEPDDAGALVIPDSVDITAPIAEPEDAAPIETADLATPDLDAEKAFDLRIQKLHEEVDRAEAEKAAPKPGEVDDAAEPEQPIEEPKSDRPAWLERALGAPEPTAPADVDAMIDQQVVTTRIEAEEEAAEKRDAGAAGLLSKFGWDGKFNKSERDEWIKGEREAGEWSEKFWQNVRDKYITPMIESELGEDGAEMRAKFGGSAAASSWFKDWIVDRVDRNIAGAKRRQFLTTEMEAGLREGAQRSTGRNLADSTGRAFVDTGLGAPIGGYGRFREIAGTEVMQRGIASGSKTAAAFGVMEYAIGKGYSHFGNWISKMGQELFPEDEARQSEWGTLMGNGAGTMAALVGPSLTASIMVKAGPKTLAAMAGNSPEALAMLQAQNARVGIAAGTTVSGGTGALMQAESEARSAEDAMKAGKTKADGTPVNQDDVNSTFFWNLPLGATEALPLGNLFGGSVRAYLGSVLREMAEEGGQEFGQTWGSNVIASLNYDPERKWDEGAWEGAAVGFILGGGVENLNQAASRLMNGKAQQKQTVRGPDGELIDAPVQEAKVRGGAGGATMTDAGEAAPVAEDEGVPEFSAMYTPKDGSVDPNDIEQYLKMYGGRRDKREPVEQNEKAATKALKALDTYAKDRGMTWAIEQGDVVIRDRNGVAATGAAGVQTQDLAEMAAGSVKAFGKSADDFLDLDNYLAQEGLDIAKGDKPAKGQRDFIAELAASLRGEEVAPGEKTATAGDYDAFRRVLAGKVPAAKWAETMGVTEEDMKALVAQAKKDGYVRGKRGKWLRTGAAKDAAAVLDAPGQFKGGETVRFKSAGNAQWQVDGVNADGTVRARRWLPGKKKWAGAVKTFAPGDKSAPVANPDKKAATRVEPTLSMPQAAEAELKKSTAESVSFSQRTAVPVKKSVFPDSIVSLIDGSRHTDLADHLAEQGLTEGQYREQFGLAPDYPMVAPEERIRRESAGERPVDTPANTEMLAGLLQSHGIDTAEFGKGEAKSLASLLKELNKGEAQMVVKDGQLLRRVTALSLDIFHDTADGRRLRLYEARQDFVDGRTRTRNMSTSIGEKLEPGEEPEASIGRALKEELGVNAFTRTGDIVRTEAKRSSPSYPGIESEYVFYTTAVDIGADDFRTEYREVQKEKTNFMRWKDVATGVEADVRIAKGSTEDLDNREAAAREIMLTPEYDKASDISNPLLLTTDLPGYGNDEWKAGREYQDGATKIKGWFNAVYHLAQKAIDKVPVPIKYERTAFLLIGYPGAGKSTIADSISREHGAVHVVADDAKLIIPEYAGGMNSSGVHDESTDIADDVTKAILSRGSNIILEKLGNNENSVAKVAALAKAHGYTKFVLVHVDVPKAVAMERAIGRWRKSGRAVGLKLYDELKAGEVYANVISSGKTDETTTINWNEAGEQWAVGQSDSTLAGLTIIPPSDVGGSVRSDGKSDQGFGGAYVAPAAGSVGQAEVPRSLAGSVAQAIAEGGSLDQDVADFALQIAQQADAGLDVSPIIDKAAGDRLLTTEDARELAELVGYPSDGATKEAALQTVRERTAALKEATDGRHEDRLLGIPASEVSGSGVSPSGSLDAEGGNAGAALQGGGPGRPGDAGNRNDQSGEQPGSAGDGVRGQGAGIGSDTAASAGDGAARRDPGAALDEADQDALDTVIEADLDAFDSERDEALPSNYVITDADEIGKGGAKAKVRGNIAAIRIIRNLEAEGRAEPTADEKAALVKYVGWGAFSQDVFATHKPEWAKERAELADLLSADEMRTARASTLNAHYTSPEVIKGVWAALEHLGVDGGFGLRAIEPAAGVGHFIGLQPETMGDTSWTAVELDQISGKITKALYGAADVRVQGFETVTWPDDHFDLAISNVPFAAEGPYDPAYKKKMTLHDYFFVKSLDKVRPGGIVAFITSNGTLDKKTSSVRRQLANKATFLGAIRLPGGSKGAFKSNAGTDVTTDIIFLRKRVSGEPLGDQSWIELGEVKTPEGVAPLNQYFVDHPEMMLGKMRLQGSMYAQNQPVLIGPVDAMETRIREAAANMLADAFVPRGQEEGLLAAHDIDTETDGIKSGAFYEKEGKLYRKVGGIGEPQKLTKKGEAVVRSFLGLRDTANALLHAQAQGTGENTDTLRFDLNEAYDAFVAEHGPINTTTIKTQNRKDGKTLTIRQKPNMAVLREDPDAYKVAAIENYDEKSGTAAKTAIFSQDVIQTYERPAIAGPTDALAVSLNETGRVDMKFIADRLGISEAEAAAELGEMVYLNPKGESWEISGQYLAGDVVEKLAQARTAAELDSRYQRNVDALEKAQPETIPRDDIGVQFGAVWVPGDVYSAFIKEVLGANVGVVLTEQTSQWSISQGFFPESAQSLYGTERVDVSSLVQATINNKPITVYDKVTTAEGGEKSVVNPKATVAAQARANALREAFQDWKYTDEARGQRLEAIYNHRFNRLAPENYDGSHLTFPGMARVVSFPDGTTGTIDLTPHRVNTIWRIVQKGNTLIDHVVGAGKAQPLDAKLLTPNGWKRMGDIAIGDEVISADGKPTRVLGVFPQGEKDIYKVTFSDGSFTECCDEHLWLTRTYRERGYAQRAARTGKTWDCAAGKVRQLSEIRTSLASDHLGAKNHSIPMVAPVEFAARHVPLDAYLVGAMIGDGCLTHKQPLFSGVDGDVLERVRAALPSDCEMRHRGGCDYAIGYTGKVAYAVGGGAVVSNPLRIAMTNLDLWGKYAYEKRVPRAYLENTIDVRVDVLRGLMDTDGTVNQSGTAVSFTTSSSGLADDVTELVQSLGGIVGRSEKRIVDARVAHVLSVCMPPEINPFWMKRKADRVVAKSKYAPARYIVAVDPVGRKQAQCIAVEHPSRLYVTDDYIVTHNTWTMIMSAMEQKRLGLIQRPMMAVPNHMLEQFSTEFLQAYPGAKLLIASKEEMSLAKRKEFAGKIAAEKWDGIIITHDAFGRIAMSDKAYQDFFNEQIDELTAAKEEAAKDEGKRVTVKNMEKAITSLKNRLQKYTNRERKDTGVTFEELGVDFIYYDEAHLAKNLGFSSQHQRVKGVNAQSQSQRAMDLFVKIRYLEKLRPGRSAVFATGTPISNTMAELFVMQKYLQLDELKAYGLDQFDAWASTFGSIVTKTELAPDGRTFRDSTAFSEFVNVPELNAIWSRVADTKTAEQLQLPRPKLLNGSPTVIEAEPTPGDLAYIEELIARAEAVKTGKVDPEEDNMLKIVSEGRKIATDGRLINIVADFNPNGKIARATEEIFKRWQSGKEPGLVQMVFLDMGVPGGKSVAKPVKAKKGKKSSGELGEIEAIRDQLLAEAGADPESAEADTEASEIISGAFDLYADLKARLVARGIPANQIAFIHDAKGDEGKARLFADVKSAKVRVLFGSTPKMGVGTNVQKRLIAMHHLDAPWKPAEVEQRDGRILRQGNMNPEIEILRYVTRQSFDSYMWQTLERKARFISQYKSGQRGARRMEDIDNPLPEAALLKAAASGDSRILEHAELSKEVQSLEGARAAHMQAGRSAGAAVKNIEASLARTEKYLAAFTADAARVTDTSGEKFLVDLTEIKPGTGKDIAERKAAGEMVRDHLLDVSTRYWSMNSDQIVGKISGFDMGAKLKRTDQGVEVAMFLQGDERYDRKDNFLLTDKSDPVMIMRRWETILKGVPASLEATTRQRETQQKDLPRLRELAAGSAFPNQAALDSAKARLAALEAALRPQEPSGDVAPAQEIPEGKVSIEDFSKEVADLKDRLGVRERPKSQLIGSNVEDAEIVPVNSADRADNDLELASLRGVDDRLERARAQGFDTSKTLYHGTSREIVGGFNLDYSGDRDAGVLGRGIYLTDESRLASSYANLSPGDTPSVLPVFARLRNPFRATNKNDYRPNETFTSKMRHLLARYAEVHPEDDLKTHMLDNAMADFEHGDDAARDVAQNITDMLEGMGYDGVIYNYPGQGNEYAVFDPANIRSVNAKFDPANAGGPLLLGSLAGLQTRRYTGPALAPKEIDGLVRAWKDLTEALDTTAAREPTRTEAESLKLLDYIQKRIGDAEVAEFPSHVPLSFRNVWDNPNLNVFQKLAKLDLLIKRWLLPDWQNIRIQDVPVNRLVYAQKGVVLDIVRKYVKQDGTKDGATSLLKYMPETGQFLVLDGTHRAMSERVRGRQVVRDAQVIYDRPWHHRLFGIKDEEIHDLTATLAKELADYGIDPNTFTEESALRSYLEGTAPQQHSGRASPENEQAAQLQVAGELLLASLAGVTKTGTDLATLPSAIEQRIAQMKQGSRLAVLADGIREFKEAADETIVLAKKAENVHIPDDVTLPQLQMLEKSMTDLIDVIQARMDIEDQLEGSVSNIEDDVTGKLHDAWNELDDLSIEATSISEEIVDAIESVEAEHGDQFWLTPEEAALEDAGEDVDPVALRDPAEDARYDVIREKMMLPYVVPAGAVTSMDIMQADAASWRPVVKAARAKYDAAYSALEAADFSRDAGIEFMRATAGIEHDFMEVGVYTGGSMDLLGKWHDDTVEALNNEMTRLREQVLQPIWSDLSDAEGAVDTARDDVLEKIEELKNPDPNLAKLSEPAIPSDPLGRVLTPRAIGQLQSTTAKERLEDYVRRALPPIVAIRVLDRIRMATPDGTMQSWMGSYNPVAKIMQISLEYGEAAAFQTANHEMIHALRRMGLFTKQEWKLLVREARKHKMTDRGGNDMEQSYRVAYRPHFEALGYTGAELEAMVDDLIDEEYVASMAEKYKDGEKFGKKTGSLLQLIFDLIDAVRNWWNNDGFFTVDQILADARSGKIAQRPLPLQEEDIVRMLKEEVTNGRDGRNDGRNAQDPARGGFAAGQSGAAQADQGSGRRTVDVTSTGILAAASQRILGGTAFDPAAVETRRVAQGFTTQAWHSTTNTYYSPSAFRPGKDFGFHVAIGSPRAANNRVGHRIGIIDKIDQALENLGRAASMRGAKPLQGAQNASILPLWVKAKNPLRMPDIGDWAAPDLWYNAVSAKGFKGPKRLAPWIKAWMVDHKWESRPDQIINSHEFSFALAGEMARLGYDSVIYKNEVEDSKDSLFVWRSNQVRSAYDSFDDRAAGKPGFMASLPYVQMDLRRRLAILAAQSGMSDVDLASIRLWHGSKHQFTRFSLDAIGTGEGAQMYGWGLYFAQSPDVAQNYAVAGDGYTFKDSAGQEVSKDDPRVLAEGYMRAERSRAQLTGPQFWQGRAIRKAAIATVEAEIKSDRGMLDLMKFTPESSFYSKRVAQHEGALAALRAKQEAVRIPNSGHTYQVVVDAEPEAMLDIDLPYAEQNASVKAAIAKVPRLQALAASEGARHPTSRFLAPETRQEAEELARAGIPGMQYYDAFSRVNFGEEGTRNYVVFDDSLIRVTERDGNPVEQDIAASIKTDLRDQGTMAEQMTSLGYSENGPPTDLVLASLHGVTPDERLERAREQGFDTSAVFYHGTKASRFDAFDPSKSRLDDADFGQGIYLTADKSYARDYGNNVHAVYLRVRNPLQVMLPVEGSAEDAIRAIYPDFVGFPLDGASAAAFSEAVRRSGYDAIDVYDGGVSRDGSKNSGPTERVVFNPANIRSVNAQFSPAAAGSPLLLASLAGVTPPSPATPVPANGVAKPLKSIPDLMEEAKTALGLTVRNGRLSSGAKAAASRAGAKLRAQFGNRSGVIRMAAPNDIVAFAHEAGHALEARPGVGGRLDILKKQHAKELTTAPTTAEVILPQGGLPPTGYTGIELNIEQQDLLAKAMLAQIKVIGAPGTPTDPALQEAAALAMQALQNVTGPKAAQYLMGLAPSFVAFARFNSGNRALRMRLMNDPEVLAELAKDFAVRFAATGTPAKAPAIKPPSRTELSEGFAEFFRRYMTDQDAARAMAPQFFGAFEEMLNIQAPGLHEQLDQIHDQYQALQKANPVEAIGARFKSTAEPHGKLKKIRREAEEKGWGNTVQDHIYSWYASWVDDKHPLKVAVARLTRIATANLSAKLKADGRVFVKAINDPYKLMRLAAHSKVHATNTLQRGVTFKGAIDPVGPSFWDVLAIAFKGNKKGEWDEALALAFNEYLGARRMMAEFERFDKGEREVEPDLTNKRQVWAQAVADLEQANPQFADAAKALYQFNQNMLTWKFQNGFIDPKMYAELQQRVDYVPLNRVMDDKSPSAGISARGSNKASVIKQQKNSSRDIIMPLESIAQDVYAFHARKAVNDVIGAMTRLAEAAGPYGGAIAERVPAEQMKGSKVNLREVIRNAAKAEGLAEGDKDALLELIDDMFDQKAAANIFRMTAINDMGESIVYLWENGERVAVRLGDDTIGQDIFALFTALGKPDSNGLIDAAALGSQVLRAGITRAPSFIVTNFLRDQVATWILSEHYTPYLTGLKGGLAISKGGTIGAGVGAVGSVIAMAAATGGYSLLVPFASAMIGGIIGGKLAGGKRVRGGIADRYSAFAGLMGGVDSDLVERVGRDRNVSELRNDSFFAGRSKGATFLRVTESTEAASRLGHFQAAYERAIKDGFSPEEAVYEAAYAAHDVLDFSRRGSKMVAAARIVTFLNVAVQGIDSLRRSLTGERNRVGKEKTIRDLTSPYLKAVTGNPLSEAERLPATMRNSAKTWVKLVSIGILGVALAALYDDDPDHEEFNDQQRATNWFFKLGGRWYKYPKPFELAFFSNLFEAAYARLWKQDPRAREQFTNSLWYSMLPPHEIPVMNLYYEMKTGHSMFGERQIVPQALQGLPPEFQFTAYTSEWGKVVGKQMGWSPAVVDHFTAGITGTLGRDFMTMSDVVIPAANKVIMDATGKAIPGASKVSRADKSVEDQMIVSRFMRRAARGALSTERFWDNMADENGLFVRASKGYKSQLDAGNKQDAKDFVQSLPPEKKAYAYLEGNFKEQEQDAHPLNRAKQVIGIMSSIRKGMTLGVLFTEESKKSDEPTRIVIDPQRQRIVNEILEDLSMREARNALVVVGDPGWAQKTIVPTAGLMKELEKAVPEIHAEIVARMEKRNKKTGAMRVYPFEGVKKAWPQIRDRLVKEGPDAMIGDLVSEAASDFEEGPQEPYRLERKRELPGMMRLGGPQLIGKLPKPMAGEQRQTNDDKILAPESYRGDDDLTNDDEFEVDPYQIPTLMNPINTGAHL